MEEDENVDERAQGVLSRRSLLGGLAAAVGTAILAACGGNATSTPAATTAATTAAGAATATKPAATSAASSAPAATAAATAAPAATTSAGTTTTGASTTGTTAAGSATSGSAAAQPTFGAVAGGATLQLTGAGSSFINPLLTTWARSFTETVAKNVTINYQSIGSGAGIQQITQKTVDFGATDAPMTDDQIKAAPGILHIPMVHGPVVATYNLKLTGKALQFSGQTLVDIYSGTITKWNDKAIAADNPGVQLPNTDIAVVYRSDGSGTTSIWVDFLSKISKDWESKVGRGTSVKFPVGIGGKGNEGVAGQVQQVEGSIGYVELAYALSNKLPVSAVKNAAGEYITPNVDSASLAAALPSYPDDLRFSITNPPAEVKGAYPITGTTWMLPYTQQTDKNKADALITFVRWAISPAGDAIAKQNNYPPIPAPLKAKVLQKLMLITVNGTPVFKG